MYALIYSLHVYLRYSRTCSPWGV